MFGSKSQLFYYTRLGFGQIFCKMSFSNVVTFWFIVKACSIYFYPFWIWNSWFFSFSNFFNFFCLCLHAWIGVGQNTVWTIPIGLRPFGLKCVSICYINYSRKVPKEFISQKFWSKKSFISTHYRYKKKIKNKNVRLIQIWI